MSTGTPILTVDGLDFSYREKPVLKDVSFEVAPGEFTAVIGPNGSGKTTLVRVLLKRLSPDAGSVRLLGQSLQDLSNRDLARHMAAVRQTIDPAPMTVRDYVLLGRMPFFAPFQFFESQRDVKIADHYMALTGISHLSDKKITRVSGGEKQLCAIARALTQEPGLLLLDEPTAHLDITHQKRILDLITSLKKRLTVLMVLHDLNLAAAYADRLVLLRAVGQETGQAAGQAEDREDRHPASSVYGFGRPGEVLTEEAVNRVYRTRVEVRPNPVSGSPWILLTREEERYENN